VLEPFAPIYVSIKNRIREEIAQGVLKPGDRVPSELQLATELGVSRTQTRQALRDLEMEGYLLRAPGRGSFVAPSDQWPGARPRTDLLQVTVAMPSNVDIYHQRLIRGFNSTLARQGFSALYFYFEGEHKDIRRYLRDLPNTGVRGLALWPHDYSDEGLDVVRELLGKSFPLVLFDNHLPSLDTDLVATENVGMYVRLTEEVISRGHKRIGFVLSDYPGPSVRERLEGYRRALDGAGLPFSKEYVVTVDDRGERTHEAAQMLARLDPQPTAYVSAHKACGFMLINELEHMGITTRDDVVCASVDDHPDPLYPNPPHWIFAEQDGYGIGSESARLLLARIAEPAKPIEVRRLPSRCQWERYVSAQGNRKEAETPLGNEP
jgi:GntR family transcriptional regulator, arabinose operon transcriptional repressor